MADLVVMEALQGAQHVWAWCLVDGGPGFAEVAFTATDGSTPVDATGDERLLSHLFSVPVSDDPRGARPDLALTGSSLVTKDMTTTKVIEPVSRWAREAAIADPAVEVHVEDVRVLGLKVAKRVTWAVYGDRIEEDE